MNDFIRERTLPGRCLPLWIFRNFATFILSLGLSIVFPIEIHAQVADLVIIHGNVLQCNSAMSRSEAIAVKDGRVLAVGTNANILPMIGTGRTRIIDAQGQTITPGFVDSHLHFLGLGQSLQMLDLRDATSWNESAEILQATVKHVWLGGVDQSALID